MHKIKIYNVAWTSTTAGPSPIKNNRTELFLCGCNKALQGNPCKGCFNPGLWDNDLKNAAVYCTTKEAADNIIRYAPNHYITIVGGEPLDQKEALAELCELLKQNGFHILLFTHYNVKDIISDMLLGVDKDVYMKLIHNIDIMVDGEYDQTERIYRDDAEDGFHDAIGSGNQIVWDFKHFNSGDFVPLMGIAARDLAGIYVLPDTDELCYITRSEDSPVEELLNVKGDIYHESSSDELSSVTNYRN